LSVDGLKLCFLISIRIEGSAGTGWGRRTGTWALVLAGESVLAPALDPVQVCRNVGPGCGTDVVAGIRQGIGYWSRNLWLRQGLGLGLIIMASN